MDGTIIGLVAVIMSLGIPLGAMYTYYRVRQLRTEERLAAIAKGVSVPMEPELSQAARSRRAGILLTCGAVGFIVARGFCKSWIGKGARFTLRPLVLRSTFLVRY